MTGPQPRRYSVHRVAYYFGHIWHFQSESRSSDQMTHGFKGLDEA